MSVSVRVRVSVRLKESARESESASEGDGEHEREHASKSVRENERWCESKWGTMTQGGAVPSPVGSARCGHSPFHILLVLSSAFLIP